MSNAKIYIGAVLILSGIGIWLYRWTSLNCFPWNCVINWPMAIILSVIILGGFCGVIVGSLEEKEKNKYK